MNRIVIYRTGNAPRKVAAATVEKRLAAIVKAGARVQRPSLVRFLLGGGFQSLPLTRQSIIDSPVRREAEATGWTVPVDSLGRGGEATASQTESLRLWVKKNLGIEGDCFAAIYVPGDEA